jgi:hypothetical protein
MAMHRKQTTGWHRDAQEAYTEDLIRRIATMTSSVNMSELLSFEQSSLKTLDTDLQEKLDDTLEQKFFELTAKECSLD